MNVRFVVSCVVASFLVLAAATQSPAQDIVIDFSWDGIPACKTLSRSPHMAVRNFPKEAKTVVLSLTQGARERGGQEVSLPASGEIPEGAATTMGPCNPGLYRWTATFKSSMGQVLGEAYAERPYSGN